MRLFFFSGLAGLEIPDDVRDLLLTFVPAPPPLSMASQPEAPSKLSKLPLVESYREYAAQLELGNVLQLLSQGKTIIAPKSWRAGKAALSAGASVLVEGDYYSGKSEPVDNADLIGPIRAVAWPFLLRAANLAQMQGNRFVLTEAGLQAMSEPASKVLRLLWQSWLNSDLLDELVRIDYIESKNACRYFTPLPPRRAAVAEVLRRCPPGQWLQLDELWRYMQAAGIEFELTANFGNLYIGDPFKGCLGSQSNLAWSATYGRYVLVFLFEYAATLGLVDVAYTAPQGARSDFRSLWGAEELPFFSRYDGLLHVRLNALGAYCLGLTADYQRSDRSELAELAVLPGLQIKVLNQHLSLLAFLLLATFAEQETPGVWRLQRAKALAAVERGHQIGELRSFLQACDEQPLPETVEGFINSVERQGRALRAQGTALLIECIDEATAEAIASHKCTQALCRRAGAKHLVVLTAMEESFRQAIHILGYGMPKF